MMGRLLWLGMSLMLVGAGVRAEANPHPIELAKSAVVVVDKKTNQLHLAEHLESEIKIIKTYHTTLGKVLGDKVVEKDLKTPEGIYFFTARLQPPGLKKKFGVLAFMTDYPNPVDRLAGKTGYDIMLHATDDPSRLQRNQDSEGCVVVGNDEIQEIAERIRLGLTPMIIYSELDARLLQANAKPDVKNAFYRWLDAWKSKNMDQYVASYSGNFRFNGMNLQQYKRYKESLNQKYASIDVQADRVRYFYHPKYDVVEFVQRYESKLKSGAKGFKSAGTKRLYFVRDGAENQVRIAEETYSNLQ